MTESEHLACQLRLENPNNESQGEIKNVELSYTKCSMKRQKKGDAEYKYGNCDFILESVAEVEHLWLIRDNILNDHRNMIFHFCLNALHSWR